jgi:hypothetical protein
MLLVAVQAAIGRAANLYVSIPARDPGAEASDLFGG